MLEMKTVCLDYNGPLTHSSDALICSYECTYCPDCAEARARVCKNCGGILVARPKRALRS